MPFNTASVVVSIVAGALLVSLVASISTPAQAEPQNRSTDWMKAGKYGAFMHFLPGDGQGLQRVREFDVEALAEQLEAAGAKWFVLTLGQNSGYFNAPNAAYDRVTGYAPGERCSARDLPADLFAALKKRGIRLMLYLPCQVPNRDARAQRAYGLREGAADQPIDLAFAHKWAEVIQEWSDRYGSKVSGWWFDGGYEWVGFNDAIAEVYARAAKHGNPRSVVTFNPGIKVIRWTRAEDYTAGELNEPLEQVPVSRWLEGSQWHALTFIGSNWGARDTRYTAAQWANWVKRATEAGGAVTLDMGPNYDPAAGPIGSLAEGQMEQAKAVRAAVRGGGGKPPKRLTRAESFLGIHFDFHAGPDCTEVGKQTTRAMVEAIIDQVHPDYVQTDCKGHPGLSSYPTRVGNRAPGIIGDPLRTWRDVTAERGVGLYMHYSGVWDSEAIRQHPDWAVVNADGSRNPSATSRFGPYAEKLLVPQLRELAGDYGVDGAWVDGECWASQPDYSPAALAAFQKATGITDVPRKPGDPHWYEFLQFNRDVFRQYLRDYIAEVKRTNPAMQLCSNWAFSDHMPEPVTAPVDWISGDFSPENAVNAARLSGRYIAAQGKPWDLMAWSFAHQAGREGWVQKPAVQLMREAAIVLALGGGFEAYFTQRRDGSVKLDELPVMAEVARFCRARQALCHRAKPVPQVALLYSTADHYRKENGLFSRDLSHLQGTLQALLEGQNSVEVLGESHLAGRMRQYPVIVIPETDYLEPAFMAEVRAYVEKGGNLLLVGPGPAALFRADLSDGHQGKLGKGTIVAMPEPFSRQYLANPSPTARMRINEIVRRLFPTPLVEVKGSRDVDVAVNRKGGLLCVNLVNTAGPHADASHGIIPSIPAVGPLEVTIRCKARPSEVRLEPDGGALPFEYRDGLVHVTVPSLEIHSVVTVKE